MKYFAQGYTQAFHENKREGIKKEIINHFKHLAKSVATYVRDNGLTLPEEPGEGVYRFIELVISENLEENDKHKLIEYIKSDEWAK